MLNQANKGRVNNLFILLAGALLFISLIILASALTPEQELLELEQELTDAGFEWFIDNDNLFKYVNYYTVK